MKYNSNVNKRKNKIGHYFIFTRTWRIFSVYNMISKEFKKSMDNYIVRHIYCSIFNLFYRQWLEDAIRGDRVRKKIGI